MWKMLTVCISVDILNHSLFISNFISSIETIVILIPNLKTWTEPTCTLWFVSTYLEYHKTTISWWLLGYRVCIRHSLWLSSYLKVFLSTEDFIDTLAIEASNHWPVLSDLLSQDLSSILNFFSAQCKQKSKISCKIINVL